MDILILIIVIILFVYLIKIGVFLIKCVMAEYDIKKRPQGFLLQTDALWIDEKYTSESTVKMLFIMML